MMSDGESADSGNLAEPQTTLPRGLELRLNEVEQFLLELIESGTRRFGELHQTRLRELASRTERAGLTESAAAILAADRPEPSGATKGCLF
jgi:hypothetical protein